VLWAHNGHVQKSGPVMGTYLAERFGAGYLSVGFAFGKGRYRAVGATGLGEHDAPPALAGSVESYLESAGLPRFVLDLRHLPAHSAAAPWLAELRPFRQIGAMALTCGYAPTVAAASHDLLIYFADMHSAVGLP